MQTQQFSNTPLFIAPSTHRRGPNWLLIAAAVLGIPPLLTVIAGGLLQVNASIGSPLMQVATALSPFSSRTIVPTAFGTTMIVHQNLMTPLLLTVGCVVLSLILPRFRHNPTLSA